MVFSTSIFIYLFLPITLLIYYIAPKKSKNFIILLSGLVFYSWGEPIYVVVMLISTMIDYFADFSACSNTADSSLKTSTQ